MLLTEQKSRLVDLLARTENRRAHLLDVLEEKAEFEQKLDSFKKRLIDIKAELGVPIDSNVSLKTLQQQLDKLAKIQENLNSMNSEYKQLRDVQLNAVKLGLPEVEKEEVDSLDVQTASLLSQTTSMLELKINDLEKLRRERSKLFSQAKEMDNWMENAEKRVDSRLRHFPVNPDSMAKLISQYKNFTRELLSRQKPFEVLKSQVGSLQVDNISSIIIFLLPSQKQVSYGQTPAT